MRGGFPCKPIESGCEDMAPRSIHIVRRRQVPLAMMIGCVIEVDHGRFLSGEAGIPERSSAGTNYRSEGLRMHTEGDWTLVRRETRLRAQKRTPRLCDRGGMLSNLI